MRNLERRVQVWLDERQYRKVTELARRRRVSLSSVIRDAIDWMPPDADLRRAAIARILAAEPMSVPADPSELRRDLDEQGGRLLGA